MPLLRVPFDLALPTHHSQSHPLSSLSRYIRHRRRSLQPLHISLPSRTDALLQCSTYLVPAFRQGTQASTSKLEPIGYLPPRYLVVGTPVLPFTCQTTCLSRFRRAHLLICAHLGSFLRFCLVTGIGAKGFRAVIHRTPAGKLNLFPSFLEALAR